MRKNVIKRIILGTVLTFALPMQTFAAGVGDAVYSTGDVNIRITPDTDSEIIGGMGYNAQCIILEGPDQYDWIKVQSGDVIGYVASQYFSDSPLASGYTLAKVEAEALFVRANKNADAGVLDSLSYGDVIEVTKDYDGSAWVEVVTKEGLYGYVSADFVTLYTYYPTAQMIYSVQEENSYSYEEYSESSDLGCYACGGEEEQSWNEYYENTYETDYDYNDEAYDDYNDYDTNDEYEEPSYEEQPTYTEDTSYDEETVYEEPAYDYSQEDQYYDSTDEEYYEYDNDEDIYDEEYYYDADEGTDVTSTNSYSGVAGTANQYLGNSYVWGGSSPGGFDCSGLAQYSYAQNGISIPRTAADQYYGGTKISVEEAVNTPGALIFYHDLGHVAISNGDGTVTHASNYDTGVITSDAYYSTPYGAVIY